MLRQIARTLPLALLATACAAEDDSLSDLGDLGDLTGLEEAGQALTDLSSKCSVNGTTLTVALNTADVAMLSKATDGKVLINGFSCASATVTSVKQMNITGTAGANQTVILDYLTGTFLLGVQGTTGVTVDLGAGGTDALKIRGTKGVDNYTFGSTGVALNTDNFLDLTVANAEGITVTMGDGADVFSGAGNVLTGGAAFATAVTVYGGAGNDSIRGGSGNDTYFGGDGADTFLTGTADDGDDEMNGGEGADTADYSGRTAALDVTVDDVADDGDTGTTELDNVMSDVEIVKGGTNGDTITGSAEANTLYGGAGVDTLAGGDGDDILFGDAGDDVFDEGMAANDSDTFNGGAGVDTVSYATRTAAVTVAISGTAVSGDTGEADKVMIDVENVTGGDGNDTVTGSSLANVLVGGAGNDTLNGGDGADTLRGGDDDDTLNGGLGDDTFDEEAADSGSDTFNGNAGVDTISYAGRGNPVDIYMDGETDCGETGEGDTVQDDVENAVGGGDDDTIVGNGLDNLLRGGVGVDDIDGGAGDDVIDGEAGADTVDCGAGDGDILLDADTATADNCEL